MPLEESHNGWVYAANHRHVPTDPTSSIPPGRCTQPLRTVAATPALSSHCKRYLVRLRLHPQHPSQPFKHPRKQCSASKHPTHLV